MFEHFANTYQSLKRAIPRAIPRAIKHMAELIAKLDFKFAEGSDINFYV